MVVYTVILMRWIGSENYGILFANVATVLILSFFVNCGMNEWLVKTITVSAIKELISSMIGLKLIVAVVWWVVIILFSSSINREIYQIGLFAIVLTEVWLDTTLNLLVAALIGFEKVKPASYILVLSGLIQLIFLNLLVVFGQESHSAILLARLVCALLCMILAWLAIALPVTQWMNIFLGVDYEKSFYSLLLSNSIPFLRTPNQSKHIYPVTVGQEIKRLLLQGLALIIKATLGVWVILRWQAYGLILLSFVIEEFVLAGFSLASKHLYLKQKMALA